ncbi:Dps family protein [Beijerinckia sp. L45]|uniref:Dps family protein n=1 Tax=Beijerinckia sp. L45 TaxID=1641855 RepID=UPI00131C4E5F|nr:DNA starvation/stationary phase protection protein [Beijerinckia sp. L45]
MRHLIPAALILLQTATGAPAAADGSAAGPFPRNDLTTQPIVEPAGGRPGLLHVVGALQRSLTALQQLELQIKQAQWNVSGTLFFPLHRMLAEQAQETTRWIDLCAERLLAVGASADGRGTTIVRTPGLPEMPGGFLDDAQVLSWFTLAYKTVGEDLKDSSKEIAEIDPASAGLLQEIERGIARAQWHMRGEFQSTATDPNTGSDLNDGKPVTPAPR